MQTVVMKFGGAAVATPECFGRIARLVKQKVKKRLRVVVVVSAMGNTTNELIQLARHVHPDPPRRELDMLVTVGERISIALLAMALAKEEIQAISFTGSQSGIITCSGHTNARIIDVRPYRIKDALALDQVVIVAGFQGVSTEKEITTLGRGGSDTTAVALGVALEAHQVEFYKDVPGVFAQDPKSCPDALRYERLAYHQAVALASNGAKVLSARSVLLAQKNGLPMHIRSFYEEGEGTWIKEEALKREVVPVYEME